MKNGTYIGYTKIQQNGSTRSNQELCSMHMRQQSREPSAHSKGASPTASVGEAHRYPPAQSPETKLQIMPVEDEIVNEGLEDEAVEVQRPNVVVVGRSVHDRSRTSRFETKFRPTLKTAEVSSHSRLLLQRTLQI